MTMRVTIKNEDAGRTLTVCEETFTVLDGSEPSVKHNSVIGPGAEQSFHIHAARRLVVNEDPSASIPAKR